MQLDQPFRKAAPAFLLFAEGPWYWSSSLFLHGGTFYGQIGVDVLCCCFKSHVVLISRLTCPTKLQKTILIAQKKRQTGQIIDRCRLCTLRNPYSSFFPKFVSHFLIFFRLGVKLLNVKDWISSSLNIRPEDAPDNWTGRINYFV